MLTVVLPEDLCAAEINIRDDIAYRLHQKQNNCREGRKEHKEKLL
jgi:hypothetical protein